eukprot:m51a1_g5454 putative adenylate guanylate cyclase (951) ;mRNA; f:217962-221919
MGGAASSAKPGGEIISEENSTKSSQKRRQRTPAVEGPPRSPPTVRTPKHVSQVIVATSKMSILPAKSLEDSSPDFIVIRPQPRRQSGSLPSGAEADPKSRVKNDVFPLQRPRSQSADLARTALSPRNLPVGVGLPDGKKQLSKLHLGPATGGDRQSELAAWAIGKFRTRVRMQQVTKSYARFVPEPVIKELGKKCIEDIDVGDFALLNRTIMVTDIRKFTALSEKMGAATTYRFVDRFMGDAIIAVFVRAGDAIKASRHLLRAIRKYNRERAAKGWDVPQPIEMGVGLHAGRIMLGTVGDAQHMTITSIGRSITVATCMEMMTKFYHCDIVASETVIKDYTPTADVVVRKIDRIKIHHDGDHLDVYQVADKGALAPTLVSLYETALEEWFARKYDQASNLFNQCTVSAPSDGPSAVLSERLWRLSHEERATADYEPVYYFTGLNVNTRSYESEYVGDTPQQFNLMRLAFSAVYHLQMRMVAKAAAPQQQQQQQQGPAPSEHDKYTTQSLEPEDYSAGAALAEAAMHRKSFRRPRLLCACHSDRVATLVVEPAPTITIEQIAAGGAAPAPVQNSAPSRSTLRIGLDPSFRGAPQIPGLLASARGLPSAMAPMISSRDVVRTDVLDVLETASIFAPTPALPALPPQQVLNARPPPAQRLQGKDRDMAKMVISGMQTSNSDAAQQLAKSYARFLPQQFLSKLGKADIQEVDIGDNVMLQMTAGAAFKVLRATSKYIAPCVLQNDGYVDKFFSDMMLALFDSASGAMEAGLQILEAVKVVNEKWSRKNRPFKLGVSIGANTGPCVLGTVGDTVRMEGTVIGNTVNVASRLLGLTKAYGVRFVTSSNTGVSVPKVHPNYSLRELDLVKLAGTNDAVWVLEVVNNAHTVFSILNDFHTALSFYHNRDFTQALEMFTQCLLIQPLDVPSQIYAERCSTLLRKGVPEDWTAVFSMSYK